MSHNAIHEGRGVGREAKSNRAYCPVPLDEIVKCDFIFFSGGMMHKNKIKFNCSNFRKSRMSFPDCCYSCGMRNGYPQNLGGDKGCENFKPMVNEMPNLLKGRPFNVRFI